MGIIGLLERAFGCAHDFTRANVGRNSKPAKGREALRRAAFRTVEALEQRVLLTATVSLTPPWGNSYENNAATLCVQASSDDGGVTALGISWGDGSSDTLDPSVTSASHTFATPGTYSITGTATDADGSVDSTPISVQVEDLALSASGGVSINSTMGQTWSGTVATFSDADPAAQASFYTATIDWGDGGSSTGTIYSNGGGNFTVNDSHAFAYPGSFSPAVTISDYGGGSATASDSASIGLPSISVNTSGNISLQQGQSYSGFIFGSITGYQSGGTISYSADTFFGGGTVDSYGNVIASGMPSAAGTYTDETVSVTQSCNGISDTETSQPFAITVVPPPPPPISASPVSIAASAGISWTGTVATFAGGDQNGSYSANVTYGPSGSCSSAGTVSSDGSGGFIVTATLLFPTTSYTTLYTGPRVDISDDAGDSATVYDSAALSLAGFSLTAPTLTVEQGQSFSGTVGQITDPVGANSNPSFFSGSLTYNGWIYGVSLSSAGAGVWNVDAPSLASLPAGTYSGSLYVNESDGYQSVSPSPATFSIDVIPPSLYASGVYIDTAAGQSWSGTVANIGDSDSYDLPASYYTAATDYDDGTSASAGQISGGGSTWTVSDSHTFPAAGSYSPTTIVYDQSHNAVVSASSTANVNLAAIGVTLNYAAALQEGVSAPVTIGTLTDAAGGYASGNYTGMLSLEGSDWTSSASFVPQGNGVYAVQVAYAPTDAFGALAAILSVSESTLGGQSVSAAVEGSVSLVDAPFNAAGNTVYGTAGQLWTGTIVTFHDDYPAGSYSATIDYGDGTIPNTGTIVSNGAGWFAVTDTHTFADAGTFYSNVSISESGITGAGTSATATAIIALPNIAVASPGDITLQEGQPLSNASFGSISSGFLPGGSISYSATTPLSGLSLSVDSNGNIIANGILAVASYTGVVLSVTETSGGQSSTANSPPFAITVQDSALTSVADTSPLLSGIVGTLLGGELLHFTDPDPTAVATQYTASVDWGDGTVDTNASVTVDANGGFDVNDTHAYSTAGTFTIAVNVTDNYGSPLSTTWNASTNWITTGLSATPVDTGAIDLGWQLAATDVYPSTDAVYVERSLSPDMGFSPVSPNLTGYGNFYLDTDPSLSEGTHYYYRLEVTESFGTVYSPVVDAWTAPAAPSTPTATAIDSTHVSVSWQNNSIDATGFQITRTGPDGTQQFTINGSYAQGAVVTYADPVSLVGAYTYQVQTIGDGGQSVLSDPSNTVTTGPAAPSDLTAVAVDASEIDLSWTNNADSYTAIEVEWSNSINGTFVPFAPTLANDTTDFPVAGLIPNTTYFYKIRALDGNTPSDFTDVVQATTQAVAAPTDLTAATSGPNEVDLSWTNNSAGDEKSYVVRDGPGTPQTWTLDAGTSEFQDMTASDNTSYTYHVYTGVGNVFSGDSNAFSVTTPPSAPIDFVATDISDSEIDLRWAESSFGSTTFRVSRSTDGVNFTPIAQGLTDPDYDDTGVTEGQEYWYRVAAVGADGASISDSAETQAATSLAAPTDMAAVENGDGNVNLSWTNQSSAATEVEIQRTLTIANTFETIATVDPTDAGKVGTFTDTTGAPGENYTYQAVAINEIAESEVSSPAMDNNGTPKNTATFRPDLPKASDLTATLLPPGSDGSESALLNWSGHGPYTIFIETGSDATIVSEVHDDIGNEVSSGTTAVVPVEPGTTYYFIVKDLSVAPEADQSMPYAEVSLTTAPTLTLPKWLTTQAGGSIGFQATLNHDAADDSSSYIKGWTADWTDGAPGDVSGVQGSDAATRNFYHTFTAPGTFYETVTVSTEAGDVTGTVEVYVTPRPVTFELDTTVSNVMGPYAITEVVGSFFTLPLKVTNPDNVEIQRWSVDWWDGNPVEQFDGSDPTLGHTYPGNYYSPLVTAFTVTGAVSMTISVYLTGGPIPFSARPAPITPWAGMIDTNNRENILEGEVWKGLVATADFINPYPTYHIDWGDGTETGGLNAIDAGNLDNIPHVYTAHGDYLVETVLDGASGWFSVDTAIIGRQGSLGIGSVTVSNDGQNDSISISAPITDYNDGHDSAVIDWGDGNGFQFAQIDGNVIKATLNHPTSEIFTPQIILSDDEGDGPVGATFNWSRLAFALNIESALDTGAGAPLPIDQTATDGGTSSPSGLVPLDEGTSGVPYYGVDGDTVPEFADGFGLNPADPNQLPGPPVDAQQSQLDIAVSGITDPSTATLTFDYDGADPADVTFTGTGTPNDPYIYSRNNTNPLRLWSNGDLGGATPHYVEPGVPYPLSEVGSILYLEGVNAAHDTPISVTLNDSSDDWQVTGSVSTDVEKMVDLSDDSDNTVPASDDSSFTPTAQEENIKSDPALPGKVIVVNDAMENGVPGFAAGYTMEPSTTASVDDAPNGMDRFVPIEVTIPEDFDPDRTKLSFTYPESDPVDVIAPSADEPNIGYSAGGGSLRIWKLEAGSTRSGLPVSGGGSFVDSDAFYEASELGAAGHTITLYVEATAASAKPGDLQVVVDLLNLATGLKQSDAVRFTSIQATPMSYGSSANVLLGDASGSDGGDPMSQSFDNAVNLADGTVSTPAVTDIASDGFGQDFGMTRVWTDRLVNQLTPGIVGNGWVVSDLPTLVNATTTIIANIDGNSSLYFDVADDGSFRARFFSTEQLSYGAAGGGSGTGATPSTYTLTDTVGDTIAFYGFDASLDVHQRGRFMGFKDAAGNAITTHYNSLGQLTSVTRTDGTLSETWDYQYNERDPQTPNAPDRVDLVTLSRDGDSRGGLVEQVAYSYYGAGDRNGGQGDLKTAVLEDAAGSPLSTWYYRYYTADDFNGDKTDPCIGLLKMVVAPDDYARQAIAEMDEGADGASDDALAQYAQFAFIYSIERQAVSQTIVGGNATGVRGYSYADSHDDAVGVNVWQNSAVVTLPDGSVESVYSNYAGEVMLDSMSPQGLPGTWNTAYIYDDAGRMILQAMPSAVSDYDPKSPDLLDKMSDGTYCFLDPDSGLIDQTIYADATTVDASHPEGYAIETDLLHGDQGLADTVSATADDICVPMSRTTYVAHTYSGTTIYVVASQKQYADANYGDAQTSDITYVEWNHFQPTDVKGAPPTISTSQHGTGSSQPVESWYDQYGRVQFSEDALGYIDYTAYDNATGAVTYSVVDADPNDLPDEPAAGAKPTRDDRLPSALALTTISYPDALGRPTKVIDPSGNVTRYSYSDTQSLSEVDMLPPAGPMQATIDNYALGFEDTATFTGGNPPTDPSALSRSGRSLLSLTRTVFNNGGQAVLSEPYFNVDSLSYDPSVWNASNYDSVPGAVAGGDAVHSEFWQHGNFYVSYQSYYPGADLFWSTDPAGVVTYIDYDGLGRQIDRRVGTDDSLTIVETDQYDHGGVGDGNLTQTTLYSGSAQTVDPNRVTDYYYDWRDRQVAVQQGAGKGVAAGPYPLTFTTYDNLGNVLETDTYTGANQSFPATLDGLPPVSSTQLRAESTNTYDDDGQLIATAVHDISQTTGADLGSLVTSNWYDADGNLIATSAPGGLWTKFAYDGAGRQTAQYVTDGAGGADDADTVDDDHVFSEQLTDYDADGNVTETTTLQRYDTIVLGGAGPTGAMTSSDSRISYVLNWYDPAGRLIETANYGTNGGTAPPATQAIRVASDGWDLSLVTTYGYSNAGYMDDVTDPRGIQTKQFFDAVGRVEQTIQGYTGQAFQWSPNASANNQITTYLYDQDGRIRFQNVKTANASGGTVSNTTEYSYFDNNAFNTPNITTYRNPDTGQDVAQTSGNYQRDTLDRLGDVTSQTDRSGMIHSYTFDAMGRQLSDTDGAFRFAGSTPLMNNWVTYRTYAYDVFGRLVDAATGNPGGVTSDDMRLYDGLGNLTDEYQDHSSAVNTSTSPDVHYNYDTSFASNYSRLEDELYPNGRTLLYNYNGNDGLDDAISRLSSISDFAGTYAGEDLESYTYLGLSTVVTRTLDQENIELSYLTADNGGTARKNPSTGQYDAGPSDPYSGLDRYGRVIDQNWFVIGGSTVDRHEYGYDADSNLLYDSNLGPTTTLQTTDSELYGGNGVAATVSSGGAVTGDYDALNRLTTFNTGQLGGSSGNATRFNAIVSAPGAGQSWQMNSQGVYQRSDVNPGTTLPTVQGFFQPDQMLQIAKSFVTITPSQQFSTIPSALSVQYDAWGDLTAMQQWTITYQVTNTAGRPSPSTATPVTSTYRYDAFGRRISDTGTQLYYDAAGNVIEERNSTSSPAATVQYVWSPIGGNTLVLRDRALYTGGNLGKPGSGLIERIYTIQDPRSNVTAILGVGTAEGFVIERYRFQPTGSVTVLDANGAVLGVGSSNSAYNWRYLYEGSRDDGGGVYYLNGLEWNSLTGLPLKEDPTAYLAADNLYQTSVIANAVTENDEISKWAERAGWVSTIAFTLATGGAAGGFAGAMRSLLALGIGTELGALAGGYYNQYVNQGDFSTGAYYGAHIGSIAGGFGPQLARAGSALLRWSDEGAQGAINLARGLSGGPPGSPAGALVSGGVLATTGDDVAAAIGAASGGPGSWWGLGGLVGSAVFSLRCPNCAFTSENGLEQWLGDVQNRQILRLSQANAREAIRGGGVYVLRDSRGTILKVGETGSFHERSGFYLRLQNLINTSGGDIGLEMELYATNSRIGQVGRRAIEDALREALENSGERLFWDGQAGRLDEFLAGQRFNLSALLRSNPNYGQTGWVMPIPR
jgi:YD repeat-containing protein